MENSETTDSYYVPKEDHIFGKCVLQIRIKDEEQYKEWQKYNGGPTRWDFIVSYPAIMRATYIFETETDLNLITRKVVQLLQMGFDVRGTDWKLSECKSLLEK